MPLCSYTITSVGMYMAHRKPIHSPKLSTWVLSTTHKFDQFQLNQSLASAAMFAMNHEDAAVNCNQSPVDNCNPSPLA